MFTHINVEGGLTVPATTLLKIPPEEQAQMRAVLRRTRYSYLLAFHSLMLCMAGRHPTEIAAFLFCSRSSVVLLKHYLERDGSAASVRPVSVDCAPHTSALMDARSAAGSERVPRHTAARGRAS